MTELNLHIAAKMLKPVDELLAMDNESLGQILSCAFIKNWFIERHAPKLKTHFSNECDKIVEEFVPEWVDKFCEQYKMDDSARDNIKGLALFVTYTSRMTGEPRAVVRRNWLNYLRNSILNTKGIERFLDPTLNKN